jgi:hypothetical protein
MIAGFRVLLVSVFLFGAAVTTFFADLFVEGVILHRAPGGVAVACMLVVWLAGLVMLIGIISLVWKEFGHDN